MRENVKSLSGGIAAGILISIGGGVFLASDTRTAGAFFFSVALLCICMLGFNLYTGKICYLASNFKLSYLGVLGFGLLGNLIGTLVSGLAVAYAVPSIGAAAKAACLTRLEAQSFFQTLIRGIFCGMLVYLSVEIYKRHKSPLGILLCIPTFILSGYEHSIADMFYFAAGRVFTVKALLFILTVILGNSLGGMLLPALELTFKEKAKEDK